MGITVKRALRALLVPAIILGVGFVTVGVAEPASAIELTTGGGANAARGDDQQADLFGADGIFRTITNVLLFLIGAVSVIMLIIGGIRYTISGGDSGQVTSAKNTILYAIIGIVVALLAFAIVNFVLGQFANGGGA